MQNYKVFVYGTLRTGGIYHDFLSGATLLEKKYLLKGHRLYDYRHWYPFMIKGQAEDRVVGELYQVDEGTLQKLNELEEVDVQVYQLVFYAEHQLYTYLKYDEDVAALLFIESGDWIQYINQLARDNKNGAISCK